MAVDCVKKEVVLRKTVEENSEGELDGESDVEDNEDSGMDVEMS